MALGIGVLNALYRGLEFQQKYMGVVAGNLSRAHISGERPKTLIASKFASMVADKGLGLTHARHIPLTLSDPFRVEVLPAKKSDVLLTGIDPVEEMHKFNEAYTWQYETQIQYGLFHRRLKALLGAIR